MFVQTDHMDAKDWRELSKYNTEPDLMSHRTSCENYCSQLKFCEREIGFDFVLLLT